MPCHAMHSTCSTVLFILSSEEKSSKSFPIHILWLGQGQESCPRFLLQETRRKTAAMAPEQEFLFKKDDDTAYQAEFRLGHCVALEKIHEQVRKSTT
jgi:hypothetical protein